MDNGGMIINSLIMVSFFQKLSFGIYINMALSNGIAYA